MARKPPGWRRLNTPHQIYRVGGTCLFVAYGTLAIEHACTLAAHCADAAGPGLVVGIVRTKVGWQVGLAPSHGSMTSIGTSAWRTEAEAQVVRVCDLVLQQHGSEVAVLQAVVAELAVPSTSVD